MHPEQIKGGISADFLTDLSGGKAYAFRMLYDAYKNNIFNSAMIYLQDEQEATEITQRVFIRLWEKHHLLINVEQLQDYLFTITKNLVFDHLKQLGRQAEILAQYRRHINNVSDNNAEESINERDIMNLWLNIVSRLPAQQQRVYVMVEQQGINLDGVSVKLSLTKATVKKHLELARGFVRSELKRSLEHHPGFSILKQSFLQMFF